jgi:hypothetical protein
LEDSKSMVKVGKMCCGVRMLKKRSSILTQEIQKHSLHRAGNRSLGGENGRTRSAGNR